MRTAYILTDFINCVVENAVYDKQKGSSFLSRPRQKNAWQQVFLCCQARYYQETFKPNNFI